MGPTPVAGSSGAGWQRRAAANAAFSMIAQVASKVSTFAWMAVAARQLTKTGFGTFSYALSLGLILASVAEWGFDTALVQRVSRTPADATRLFTLAVTCEAILAVPIFLVVGAVAAGSLHGDAQVALAVVLLAVFFDTFTDTVRGVAAGLQHQRSTATALTIARVATACIAIPVLVLGGGLVGLSVVLLGTYLAGLVIHLAALSRLGVSLRPSQLDKVGLVGFVRGTAAMGISTLVLAALARFDVVLLEALKGARTVATYTTSYRLFETVLFLTFAINGALFPVLASQAHDRDEVAETLTGGGVLLVGLYVPFAAVCLLRGEDVLNLLFGVRYGQAAAGALSWLAVAPISFSMSFLFGSALVAFSRPRGLVVSAVLATAVNVAGDLILIPHFGGSAAAAFTTLGYTVEASVLYLAYRRTDGAPTSILRRMAPVVGAAVPLAAALLLIPGPTAASVGVAGILYACTWLALTRWWSPRQFELLQQMARRRAAPASPPVPEGYSI